MKEHHSIFWPLTLIAAGAVWLMISMNVIPAANLWALAHIWPYLLIAMGVGLILHSFWKPFGMIVSALVVVGAVAVVFYAPQLGWDKATQWQRVFNDSGYSDGIVPGSGTIKKETREVKNFDALSIRFPAEVTIRQGEAETLTVEADDNLLPQLSTEVRAGTLVIESAEKSRSKRVRPTETVKITITVKKLTGIDFSSAGILTVNGLKTDQLTLSVSGANETSMPGLDTRSLSVALSGAGSIHADGVADNVVIHISGLGEFIGEGLTSQTADIEISGAGTATLRVEKKLTAEISGAGAINYYGHPDVNQHVSGAGTVSKAGD